MTYLAKRPKPKGVLVIFRAVDAESNARFPTGALKTRLQVFVFGGGTSTRNKTCVYNLEHRPRRRRAALSTALGERLGSQGLRLSFVIGFQERSKD